MSKVLAIAVHPDDETLGCGGALLRHKQNGDEIHWLIATDLKQSEGFEQEKINARSQEINLVASLYKFDSISQLNLSTMRVDEYSMSELIEKISRVINEVKPNIVYLPFKGDIHSDHRTIFNAAYSCTKSFRYPFIKKIYMIEALSETEFSLSTQGDNFVPNVFVDITGFMDTKLQIMRVYSSELGQHPFPRSERNLKALATLRGATAGCEYAESFMLLKEIL